MASAEVPQAEHDALVARHARLKAEYARQLALCREALARLDRLRDSYHSLVEQLDARDSRAARDGLLPRATALPLAGR
jgi:hypothetical protein